MATQDQNTLLQTVFGVFESEAEKLYEVLVGEIEKNLRQGLTISKAVDKAFKDVDYENAMESLYSSGLGSTASGAVVGTVIDIDPDKASNYFLFTNFKGGSLNKNLHSGEAPRIVKTTLRDFFTKKTNVEALFRKLKDGGFDSFDKIPAVLNNAIKQFETAGYVTKEVEDAIREARLYTQSLSGVERSSEQLKRSYNKVLDAIESGEEALVNKAVNVAVKKKIDYNNKRIARTEFGRAYEMSFQRAMYEDPEIIGFKVILSSRHNVTDICDCYAEADMYGLGEGICPVDAGVNIPFHPNCLCGKVFIRANPDEEKKARYSQTRVNEYLSNIDEKKRRSILGVKNATNKDNYKKGLEKHGFSITKNPKMFPKDLIEMKRP